MACETHTSSQNEVFQGSILSIPKSSLLSEDATFEHVEDISIPHQNESTSKTTSKPTSFASQSLLLSLPLELRLKIYVYLLDLHPTTNPHLTPNPTISATGHTHPPSLQLPLNFPATSSSSIRSASREMGAFLRNGSRESVPGSFYTLPAKRYIPALSFFNDREGEVRVIPGPRSVVTRGSMPYVRKLPSAFLQVNRQIYEEARILPFQSNTHIFMNWYQSGLNPAILFAKRLVPWQRESIRHIGLEIGGVELVGRKGSCADEWLEFCTIWKGIRGLSLSIKGNIGGYGVLVDPSFASTSSSVTTSRINTTSEHEDVSDELGRERRGRPAKREEKIFIERSVLDGAADWVVKGLGKMKGLRELELAVLDRECEGGEKLAFARELGVVLGGVRVKIRKV